MNRLIIAFLIIAAPCFAQQIRPITQVNDINLVGQEYHTKPVQWFAGDSIKFDVYARDVRTPVDFSGAAFPVLFVAAETNVAQVYILATGTVVSATNGHVSVSVSADSALLDPAISYAAWVTVFRVADSATQEVATVAYSQATVRESPLGTDYTYLPPTNAPFIFNVGAIQVNPTNWSQFPAQRMVDAAGKGITNAGPIYGSAHGLTNFPAALATDAEVTAGVTEATEAASNKLYAAAYIPSVREPTQLHFSLGDIWDEDERYVWTVENDATYIRTHSANLGRPGKIDLRSRFEYYNDAGNQFVIGSNPATNAFTFRSAVLNDFSTNGGDFVIAWDSPDYSADFPGRFIIGKDYVFHWNLADFGRAVLKGNGSLLTDIPATNLTGVPASWTAQPSLLALSNSHAATESKAGYASNRANFAYTLADQANTLASGADTDTVARASIVTVGSVASQALAIASAPTDAVARVSALAQGVVASNALALASGADTDTTARAWAQAASNLALSASQASTDATARAWAQAGSNLAASAFAVASSADTDVTARAWATGASNRADAAYAYAGSNASLISAETSARIASDAASSSTVSTLSARYAGTSNRLDVLSLSVASISSKVDTVYGWGNHASAGYLASISLNGGLTVRTNLIKTAVDVDGNHAVMIGRDAPDGTTFPNTELWVQSGVSIDGNGMLLSSGQISMREGSDAARLVMQKSGDEFSFKLNNASDGQPRESASFLFQNKIIVKNASGTAYVQITPTDGLQIGEASFHADTAGNIWQDSTNTAVLGILSASSIKNTNGTSVLYAGEAPTTAAFLSLSGRVTTAEGTLATTTGNVAAASAAIVASSNALAAAIGSEASARIGADAALTASVSAVSAALVATSNTLAGSVSSEASARIGADAALTGLVSSLTATLTGTSNTLAGLYAAETAARIAADASLTSGLASAVASVGAASNTLAASIAAEVLARAGADSTITASVAAVSAALLASSNSLAADISAEASGRIDADAALSNLVAAAEAATVALGYIVSNSVDAARLGGSLPAAYFLLTDFQAEMTNRVRMVSGVESNSAPGGFAWVQLVPKGGGTNELWVYGDHALGTNTPGWAIFDGRTP